ncbi:MAG: hypothetical protein ACRD2D_12245 [Terriglobales bacterium]
MSRVTIEWEGLRFALDQGRLALGTTDGRITVAVFAGSGRVAVALPAAPPWRQIEQNQVERYLAREQIAGGITQAVFRFADAQRFRRALGPSTQFAAADAGSELRHILQDRARQLERNGADTLARQQRALARAQPGPLLLAEVKRVDDGAWVKLRFDPAAAEPLAVEAEAKPGEPAAIWSEYAPPGWPAPVVWRAEHYHLAVKVIGHQDVDLMASFALSAPAVAGVGVLLRLDPRMRVRRANLPWYQPPAPADWIYLERPASADTPTLVTLQAAGGAVIRAPADHDWVTAADWYPTPYGAQFGPATDFAVTAEAAELPVQTSATTTDAAAAGFAWGDDTVDTRPLRLADGQAVALTVAVPRKEDPRALIALAGSKSVQILNFLSAANGPLPITAQRLVVSGAAPEAPLPGLISLDPRSFLGLSPELTQFAPALSLAGQWWGTSLRAASAHEEWLIAGMRQLDALLYQESQYGLEAGLTTIRSWRQYLSEPTEGRAPLAAGPLWLGERRLSAPQEFHGGLDGGDLLEAKGGAELYMLRQMLWQPRSPTPDAAFRGLLHDFTQRYVGQAITNAEFQAVAEAHMTPAMDLDHNHKLNWFFQPLLYCTRVPELHFAATAKGNHVVMSVENPDHWRGLLPVYLFHDPDHWVRGLMAITGARNQMTVTAPFAPQYIQANYFEDMLVRVTQ